MNVSGHESCVARESEGIPDFTTLPRGTRTASFIGNPGPRVDERREWVAFTGVVGAGDWEREEELVAATVLPGGPFAQADSEGGWEGFFWTVAMDGLLILHDG